MARKIQQHWENSGYTITSVGGFDVGHPTINGISQPDGYTLALVWTEGDGLYLAATSPCLWPDGKAPDPAG
ncbi:hypothetical protein [Nonomuraea cavernae]|uniref:hypothetical protein n=1 Tax=Nonomuraea cavernae TaxID=2045107 RepID=UPI00166DDA45|nr:hypothetical protein [Nonomuraea cavernae]MCA2185227.1 hypothetical protein [Nonomuraea cavernae]